MALPRHQTLRATVDWSYDLLSEPERLLFNRLAVFAGGFTLEAAEAVGTGERVEADDVLDLLSRLVDKSLVTAEEGTDDSVRYRLLETLRQYGRERLIASGETEETQRRHAAYFLALAEEAEPKLTGPEQVVWLDRLETEHDNLRAALRWVRASGEAETGLRLGGALWWFWYVRGYYLEGRERLAELLALPGAAGRTAARAKVLNGAGVMAWAQGDYAPARTLHEESLAIRRELGDRRDIARSLNNLGILSYRQGDYTAARSFYEESLAILRELGDKRNIAASLNNLGQVAHDQGDYAVARSLYEESLALFRELGDKRGIAYSLNNLGDAVLGQGDYAAAKSLYAESLVIQRELGDKSGIAEELGHLGEVALGQGDHAAARSLCGESLAMRMELGDRRGIAKSLEGFVGLAAAQTQPERALLLAGAAAALRETIGAPLSPAERPRLERHLETAHQALDEEASAKAFAAGRAMTLEQAIAYALEESSHQEDAPS